MAIQTINLGEVVNDGTGDDLRTAFEKVVFNFTDIDGRLDDSLLITNIGSVGEGIFKEKVGREVKLKKLAGDVNIIVNDDGDTLSVDLDISSEVDFNSQNAINLGNVTVLGNISLDGPTSRMFGNVTGTVTGTLIGVVYAPNTPGSFGLRGNVVGFNPDSGVEDPTYQPALVDGVSVLDLSRAVNNFDFGAIGNIDGTLTFTSAIDYLLNQIGTDLGSVTSPAPFNINLGTL